MKKKILIPVGILLVLVAVFVAIKCRHCFIGKTGAEQAFVQWFESAQEHFNENREEIRAKRAKLLEMRKRRDGARIFQLSEDSLLIMGGVLFPPELYSIGGKNFTSFPAHHMMSVEAAYMMGSDHILAIGMDGFQGPLECEILQISTKVWKPAPCLQRVGSYFQHTQLKDNRVVVAGASEGTVVFEVFNPKKMQWQVLPSVALPDNGNGVSLVPLASGKLFVMASDRDRPARVVLFDFNSNSWSQPIDFPTKRSGAAVVTLTDDRVFIVGGLGAAGELFETTFFFDEKAMKFVEGPKMAHKRSDPVVYPLRDGRVLALGSVNEGRDRGEIWDPKTNQWQLLPMGEFGAGSSVGVTQLQSGRVLLIGGHYRSREAFRFLDPRTLGWENVEF